MAAFDRFDPQRPTASRFVDEDLNRVWDATLLNGPRHSIELDRARDLRPFVDSVDVLLDLHSMLWPSEPLILSGAPMKGRELAKAIGTPSLVVSDHGHVNGRRLIDYPRFANPDTPYAACLVEAGQHWEQTTVDVLLASVAGLLRHLNIAAPDAPLPPAPVQKRDTYRNRHHGGYGDDLQFCLCADLSRGRYRPAPRYPDRDGR